MPGCASLPAACASLRKRASIAAAARSPSTSSLRMVLMATVRRMPGSNPLYTTPMAPCPSTSVISYLPRWWGMVIRRSRRRSGSALGVRAGILCFFEPTGGTHAFAARLRHRSFQPVRQRLFAGLRRDRHHRAVRRLGERRAAGAQGPARAERLPPRRYDRHFCRHALRLRLHRAPCGERRELHHGGAQIEFPEYRAGGHALRRGARRAPGAQHPRLGRGGDPWRRAAQTRALPLHPAGPVSEVKREQTALSGRRLPLRFLGPVRLQGEIEDRAFVGPGLGPDAAAVAYDDALYAGEADARALELLRRVKALEYAEEPVRLAHVEARAVVLHVVDRRAARRLRRLDSDLHARGVPPARESGR